MPETFDYVDGNGVSRKGDPTELLRRLYAYANGDLNEIIEQSESELPEMAIPAADRLAKVACSAFKLSAPYDDVTGIGTMEETWRGVLNNFLEFVAKKETPAVPSPTLSPSTESASSPSATATNSDSTSTSAA